jgi:hypothetical protein
MVKTYRCWTVAAGRTPAERDVTSGIADWDMGIIVTPELGDDIA